MRTSSFKDEERIVRRSNIAANVGSMDMLGLPVLGCGRLYGNGKWFSHVQTKE